MKEQIVNGALNTPIAGADDTRQQVKLLAVSNACLRRNLIRFSRKLKQVGHLAYHDELTGLPNRNLLLDRLHQALQQAMRQHKQVLLLFIDLDRFKWINEQLGYLAGDKLLQQVATRLAANIRGADTACRYGSDEFVVMLPDVEQQQNADAVIKKIYAQFTEPYVIDDKAITLTASIGTAVYRGAQQSGEDLIRQANIDMYRAKANSIPPAIALV
ncbi:MAG: diguanylate cyclase domain-containing protein [Burkholderiales bacterium]